MVFTMWTVQSMKVLRGPFVLRYRWMNLVGFTVLMNGTKSANKLSFDDHHNWTYGGNSTGTISSEDLEPNSLCQRTFCHECKSHTSVLGP